MAKKFSELPRRSNPEREYTRAEDTFLLEDGMKGASGFSALEIGTGSGYLTKILEDSFELVVATDINFEALRTQTFSCKNAVCCDGADALAAKFELIICNLPYVESDTVTTRATDGGERGVKVPLHILESAIPKIAPTGRFLFVTSSISHPEELVSLLNRSGLVTRTLLTKKLFFEELVLIEASYP